VSTEMLCARCKKPLAQLDGMGKYFPPDPQPCTMTLLDGSEVHVQCVPKEVLIGERETLE